MSVKCINAATCGEQCTSNGEVVIDSHCVGGILGKGVSDGRPATAELSTQGGANCNVQGSAFNGQQVATPQQISQNIDQNSGTVRDGLRQCGVLSGNQPDCQGCNVTNTQFQVVDVSIKSLKQTLQNIRLAAERNRTQQKRQERRQLI